MVLAIAETLIAETLTKLKSETLTDPITQDNSRIQTLF